MISQRRMQDKQNSVTLESALAGRKGLITLRARCGGDALHVEKLDIAKSKDRTTFVESVCKKRPDINRQTLEEDILALAAKVNSDN